ncbi:MAG: hypothetical protein H6995_04160 [Pseudomonadales bacterium]|jgi:hypothetical protein|nr:hypothetical protein [Pseudomonadales bacterium]MCP5214185.1 hypothetical protein [Pseudomonadales bacterium]MCP5302621.1 hypothetical protein [Pseudomonadales bacterium]
MNTVLLILGILGIGAILIAAYVFTVAARNYISDSNSSLEVVEDEGQKRLYVVRTHHDRRQFTGNTKFPITLPTGEVVRFDRRSATDRRAVSA